MTEYKLPHCSGTFLDVPVLLSSFQASSYSGSSVPRTWSPLIQPPPIGGWTRTLYLLLRSLTQSIPWVIWTASVTCLLRAVKRMEVNWMPNPPPPWVPLECCHSTDEASPLTGSPAFLWEKSHMCFFKCSEQLWLISPKNQVLVLLFLPSTKSPKIL